MYLIDADHSCSVFFTEHLEPMSKVPEETSPLYGLMHTIFNTEQGRHGIYDDQLHWVLSQQRRELVLQ